MATDRNANQVTALIAKSNAADSADVIVWADPTTHRLLVDATASLVPSASATGLTTSLTDAEVATVITVKASSGRVYGYHIYNPTSLDAFLHFYDTSGAVTVGTTTRVRSLYVPAKGVIDTAMTYGLTFANAIKTAATTTLTGLTGPGTGLQVNIDYI